MGKYDWESGLRVGRLTLTGKSYLANKRRYVEWLCECGRKGWSRWDGIKRGICNSCGCFNTDRLKTQSTKPAVTHGLHKHPLYAILRSIKDRCYKPSHEAYKNYGAKGVIVCELWLKDFVAFFNWAIDKWKPDLQLDKDILYNKKFGTKTGKIYSPEYCCFITAKENSRNRNSSRFLEYNGQKKTSAEWAEEFGLSQQIISHRLNDYGWSVEKTLTTPPQIQNKKRLSP